MKIAVGAFSRRELKKSLKFSLSSDSIFIIALNLTFPISYYEFIPLRRFKDRDTYRIRVRLLLNVHSR